MSAVGRNLQTKSKRTWGKHGDPGAAKRVNTFLPSQNALAVFSLSLDGTRRIFLLILPSVDVILVFVYIRQSVLNK